MQNEHALSHAEIESHIDIAHDQVAVVSHIETFLENSLIHKVLDDGGLTKYALCSECTKEEHHHEHVYFKCNNCGQTICIDEIKIPTISLPAGYNITETNLLIKGVCSHCSQ